MKPVVILSSNAVFEKLKNLDCRRAAAFFLEPSPGGSRGPVILLPTGRVRACVRANNCEAVLCW